MVRAKVSNRGIISRKQPGCFPPKPVLCRVRQTTAKQTSRGSVRGRKQPLAVGTKRLVWTTGCPQLIDYNAFGFGRIAFRAVPCDWGWQNFQATFGAVLCRSEAADLSSSEGEARRDGNGLTALSKALQISCFASVQAMIPRSTLRPGAKHIVESTHESFVIGTIESNFVEGSMEWPVSCSDPEGPSAVWNWIGLPHPDDREKREFQTDAPRRPFP
jgi:hypothetical protein